MADLQSTTIRGQLTLVDQPTLAGHAVRNDDARLALVAVLQAALDEETTTRIDQIAATNSLLTGLTVTVGANAAAILQEATVRADADSAQATLITSVTATANAASAAIVQEVTARVNAISAIATQITTITAQVAANAAAIIAEATARANADSAMATSLTTLTASVAANAAAITAEATVRANADSASATTVTTLTATVGANTAAITAEATARANGDSAVAATVTALTATVGANTAAITAEATARANADSAMSETVTELTATVGENTAAITAEATARADAVSAVAETVTALTATVGENTAAITEEAEARIDQFGAIGVRHTLKLDVNGKIVGRVTLSGDDETSTYEVAVDTYRVLNKDYPANSFPSKVIGSGSWELFETDLGSGTANIFKRATDGVTVPRSANVAVLGTLKGVGVGTGFAANRVRLAGLNTFVIHFNGQCKTGVTVWYRITPTFTDWRPIGAFGWLAPNVSLVGDDIPEFSDPPDSSEMADLRTLVNAIKAQLLAGVHNGFRTVSGFAELDIAVGALESIEFGFNGLNGDGDGDTETPANNDIYAGELMVEVVNY